MPKAEIKKDNPFRGLPLWSAAINVTHVSIKLIKIFLMATQTNKTWLQKYWRGLLTLVLAIFVVVSAVLGDGWSDNADKKFWWQTWAVWQIVCIVAIIALWVKAWTSKRNK